MPERPDHFIASFMDDYFAESEEHLAAVRRALLLLEPAIGHADPPAPLIEELFRSFHSLKGISAMVELREAERLAHEMESYLGAIRRKQVGLSAAGFEALVDGTTTLEQVVQARRLDAAPPAIDARVARLAAVTTTTAPPAASRPADADLERSGERQWRVTFAPSPELVARGIKIDAIRTRLAEVARVESVTPQVTQGGGIAFQFLVTAPDDHPFAAWAADGITYEPAAAEPASEAAAPAEPAGPTTLRGAKGQAAVTNFVRVDLVRLDELMRLVGDLVVSRARLDDTLQRVEPFVPAADWRTLQEEAGTIERLLRGLREGVMRVRLVPVAEIFRRMPFVVRDLARDSGKRVRLDLVGQATEIDKFLIERMVDPMLHLVRNAVAHAIEPPDERIAAGKPPDGTVRLAASTVGESVVLEVRDDGRGMNARTIAARARAAGLAVPDGDLDAASLLEVICAPGFSTRDAADRASGRGVGMSVVRDTVQELGGTLTLETAPGQGTTFRMVLPLTLAIADALIVHVGERTFAIPQAAVERVAEVDMAAVRALENNELMTFRGATIPVVRLGRLFGLESAARSRMHALIAGAGGAAVAILVDRISGQREIVVKTLRDPLVRVTGISGATELGDGRLVLIVDVAALTRSLRGRQTRVRAAL